MDSQIVQCAENLKRKRLKLERAENSLFLADFCSILGCLNSFTHLRSIQDYLGRGAVFSFSRGRRWIFFLSKTKSTGHFTGYKSRELSPFLCTKVFCVLLTSFSMSYFNPVYSSAVTLPRRRFFSKRERSIPGGGIAACHTHPYRKKGPARVFKRSIQSEVCEVDLSLMSNSSRTY